MAKPPKNPSLSHGCIIMASGMGTRFGGNKLMAPFNGIPLIQHVIAATSDAFNECIVVTRHAEVARLCQSLGVRAILHDRPHRSDTVRLGMEAIGNCDTITFFQADQPLIRAESVAHLLRHAESDPNSIWRASFQGTAGAPVLFPKWAFDQLRSLPVGKGGGFVAKAHPDRVRTVEVSNEWELFDVDTPEDLQLLQGRSRSKA